MNAKFIHADSKMKCAIALHASRRITSADFYNGIAAQASWGQRRIKGVLQSRAQNAPSVARGIEVS
nr:hypothetical protein [uncultured bacterium]QLG20489.1 hypothetical protein [uncultured bacterium]